MKKTKDTLPILLCIVFLLIGISIRFIQLGENPLTHNESALAFQTLEGLKGNLADPIYQSSYFGLTILSIFLTTSSNFIARFWPALFGSLLLFIPLIWKKELGQATTLGLVFAMSIDPVLVYASRTIGSPIFAVVGWFACLSLFYKKRHFLSGIALAIALLGGESFWFGLIIFVLSVTIFKLFNMFDKGTENRPFINLKELISEKEQGRSFVMGFVISLLLIGSGFFLYPSGLSNIMTGFVTFFQKFFVKSGIKFWQPAFAIFSYLFLPLIIAIWAGIYAWVKKDTFGKWLSVYAILILVFVTILPSRRYMDIIWFAIPIWVLSIRFITKSITWSREGFWIKIILAMITIIALVFLTLIIRSFVNPEYSRMTVGSYIIIPVAVVLLLSVTVVLVGLGWYFSYSLNGFFSGVLIFFLSLTFSLSMSEVFNRSEYKVELWHIEKSLQTSSLIETIETISDHYLGDYNSVEIFVIGIDDAQLKWSLRQFENVVYYQDFPRGLQPDFVITLTNNLDNLVTTYRGEEILGYQAPTLDQFVFMDYIKWLVDRKVEYTRDSLYLWVNSNLFPGG